ncbi:MAG: hypothetical protein QW041_00460 [Candidatus Pacearchaeota archaeon]
MNKIKKLKKAQGMQFSWIFALIIGGVILFFAIFFSGKLFQLKTYEAEAELTKNLDILLNPFTSISYAEVTLSKPISLAKKTEINFSCNSMDDLQTISTKIGKAESFSYNIRNKYIFSEDFNTKELWVFAKPFNMPWKVDDLIFVVSKDYCFVNPPEKIKNELSNLNATLIKVVSDIRNCKQESAKVCFSGTCDIYVNTASSYVKTKQGSFNFLDDSSMYAAIFGSKQYSCNLERLFKRLEIQTNIFLKKADLLSARGCYEAEKIKPSLKKMETAVKARDYMNIKTTAIEIESNNPVLCPLY